MRSGPGAAYLDTFDGTMIGNGILPVAAASGSPLLPPGPWQRTPPRCSTPPRPSVHLQARQHRQVGAQLLQRDWETWPPGRSQTFTIPSGNSGVGLAISNGMIQTAEGAMTPWLQEFWPDISRKLFHKDPTHGRDAQFQAEATPAPGEPAAASSRAVHAEQSSEIAHAPVGRNKSGRWKMRSITALPAKEENAVNERSSPLPASKAFVALQLLVRQHATSRIDGDWKSEVFMRAHKRAP